MNKWKAVEPCDWEAVDLQIKKKRRWFGHGDREASHELESSETALKRETKDNVAEGGEGGGRSSRENVEISPWGRSRRTQVSAGRSDNTVLYSISRDWGGIARSRGHDLGLVHTATAQLVWYKSEAKVLYQYTFLYRKLTPPAWSSFCSMIELIKANLHKLYCLNIWNDAYEGKL